MPTSAGITFLGKPTQVEMGTHNGARNKPNEDRFVAFTGPGSNGQPAQFLVVADGVTSTHGGERASDIAVRMLQQLLQNPQTSGRPPKPMRDRLADAIHIANQEILETARKDPELRGMSTTLVAAVVDGDQLTLMHLGDSRAYLIRNGKAYQLTHDHTWVQEAMDEGRITAEQARTHPNKHVIQRYLGDARGVSIDQGVLDPEKPAGDPDETEIGRQQARASDTTMTLRAGDALLLCSDGLYNRISDAEMAAAVTSFSPEKAVKSLIEQAVKRDEPDNITVMLWPTGGTPAVVAAKRRPALALALAGAALVVLAFLAIWLMSGQSGTTGQAGGEAMVVTTSPMVSAAAVVTADPPTGTPESMATPTARPTAPPIAPMADVAQTGVSSTDTQATAVVEAAATATAAAMPSATPLPVSAPVTTEGGEGQLTAPTRETLPSEQAATLTMVAATQLPSPMPIGTTSNASLSRPTSTPMSTSTPAPTATPVPTATGIATPTRRPTPTATVAETNLTAPPVGPAATAGLGPSSVQIQAPADNANSADLTQFAWKPDQPLAPGQEFEVLFWRANEPESTARGWVRSGTANSIVVNPVQQPLDTYRWVVYLVNTDPYERLLRLSEPRNFTASAGGSSGGSGGGSCVGENCGK